MTVPGAYAVAPTEGQTAGIGDREQQQELEEQDDDDDEQDVVDVEAAHPHNVEDLVLANPVADTDSRLDLPVAEQVHRGTASHRRGQNVAVDPTGGKWCTRQTTPKRIGLAFGLAAIVVGVTVLLVLLLEGRSGGDTNSVPDAAINAQDIVQALLPDYTLNAMEENPKSPQAMAYKFVTEDPSLVEYNDWRIRQRFALATFFLLQEAQSGRIRPVG